MNDFSPHISKKIFLVVLMSAFFVNVYSQDEKEEYKLSSNVWFLGVDASVNSIYTDDNIHIMENLRDVYSYNYVSSKAYGSNFGINTEYRLLPRFGIITGLRYTLLQKNYSSNDFMYFNYKNDENGVYYAKLTDIKENIHFVTVPVSFKFLAHSAKYFGINIKLDFDFNFRVASSYRIGFEDEEMVSTKKEIKNSIKDKDFLFYYGIAPAFELRFAQESGVHVNVAFIFPMFTRSNTSRIENFGDAGARISLVCPISKLCCKKINN